MLESTIPRNADKYGFFKYFEKLFIFICLMLVIAGVEPNPGPTSSKDSPPAKRRYHAYKSGRPVIHMLKSFINYYYYLCQLYVYKYNLIDLQEDQD